MQILVFALLLLAQLSVGVSIANNFLHSRALTKIICRSVPNYSHANKATIEEGIAYLRAHQPQGISLCHYPGGGCCTRVSYDMNPAIYASNDDPDNDKDVTLGAVADLAEAITRGPGCVWKPSTSHVVLGQAFDDGWWNAIVGIKNGDSC